MFDKDLYEILGVSKGATEKEIRKAFHKLAKQYHPDVKPGDKAAEQKFKEVNLAYEVLKDKKKRERYDQMRAAGRNPFAGAQQQGPGGGFGGGDPFGDFGLGDLFEEIFGGGGFAGMGMGGGPGGRVHFRTGTRGFARRGADQEATLDVSFLEAARGAEKTIELGSGKRITVKIPEGVDTGSRIKLRGQGEPGMGGAPSGDLVLNLRVHGHSEFRREGNHVVLELPVTFSEAVLGTELQVPTLDGNVLLKVPPGVSSGQRLKLTGKGVRGADGNRGDQFVEIKIKVPRSPDEKYVRAAEELRGHPFLPR